jgi:hypothetical protein
MRLNNKLFAGVLFALGLVGSVSATIVSVDGTAGPWDPLLAGNFAYGVGDETAAASVAVNAGDSITITYLAGATSAFGGVPPSVDALGYTGSIFGSGTGGSCPVGGCTGIGSSGNFFPSAFIDPLNTGSQIALNALIGAFVDSSGLVLSAFVTGNGPFVIVAPVGAVALQLGMNDDIFTSGVGPLGNSPALINPDNTGSLRISVTGSTVGSVPEPATLVLLGAGLAAIGWSRRRKPG